MAERRRRTTIRRRRSKPWLLLAILAVALIGTFVLLRIRVRWQLRAKLQAIRAAGHPVSFDELDEWYSIPAGQENAADTFERAFPLYVHPNDTDRKSLPFVGRAQLPARTDPIDQGTEKLIAKCITDNKKALGLLDKGAAITHSRYPVDFSAGFGTTMSHLSHTCKGVRLLSLRAAMEAEHGRTELSVRSVQSALAVARSLANEPAIVSQLSRTSCHRLVVSVLERILNATELADEQLLELGQAFACAEDTSALSRALIGERCMGIDGFSQSVSESIATVRLFRSQRFVAPRVAFYKFAGFSDHGLLIYLDLMEQYIEAFQLPLHRRYKAVAEVDAKRSSTSQIHVLLHTFTGSFTDSFRGLANTELKGIALLRAAAAAVAVQRYRQRTGHRPENLSQLVPGYLAEVPKDPFDGNDLRYSKLRRGFVVYSIGQDGQDHGGKEGPPHGEREDTSAGRDVTFIVER